METTEKVNKALSQNQDINSCRVLYASKYNEVLPILMQGKRDGDDLLQFFGTHESEIFHAIDYIIMNYHQTNSGRITIGMLWDAVKEVAQSYEMARYSLNINPLNDNSGGVEYVKCTSEEETLFAVGTLDEDYKDSDNDPYETAGGYRSWIAKAGTTVKYYLNKNLSVLAVFESNCEVDHYNNNFCGNSTGGGTTTYKLGERIALRSVTMGKEWNYYEWSKPKFKATVKKVDAEKVKALVIKFQPEFEFLFK